MSTSDTLLITPLLAPFLAAIFGLLFFQSLAAQRVCALLGPLGLSIAGLMLVVVVHDGTVITSQIGNWRAPFGITFVADRLSAVLVLLTGIMGMCASLFSLASIDIQRKNFGYYPLLNLLLMGVSGAFLTGDMFNMFVWFEVLLIASFVLMALGSGRAQLEGAMKYVTINLLASTLFLTALGILYAEAGTLNMADLAQILPTLAHPGLITTLAVMFMIAFGIKAALFPLFFWLPASYHTPPAAVSAIFAALLTKVGVYALMRSFTLIFIQDPAYTHTLLLIFAALTMITGSLGALAQTELRRILSFLVIGHIGIALVGLAVGTAESLAGTLFYLIEDMVVLTALFLLSGIIEHYGGGRGDLKGLGGLYNKAPGLTILFFIPAFSMAGIPPLSGFFAKLSLIKSGLAAEHYLIIGIMLFASVLTLIAISRIWSEVFWKPAPESGLGAGPVRMNIRGTILLWGPLVLLAALVIGLGLGVGPVYSYALGAGQQLADPVDYVRAVLNQ